MVLERIEETTANDRLRKMSGLGGWLSVLVIIVEKCRLDPETPETLEPKGVEVSVST